MNGRGAELSSTNELQTRAAHLRRAVNASRARLGEQNLRAEALRLELTALRTRAARAAKEAVSDSAPAAAAPLAAQRHGLTRSVLSLAALGLSILALAAVAPAREPDAASNAPLPAETASAAPRLPALPALESTRPGESIPTDDDEAAQALLLAAAWRDPEDGQTLDERLGPPVDLPGVPPEWNAERTGARSYLVRRRGPAGEIEELSVDLALGSVEPSRAARPRRTPALVTRR